MNINFVMKTFAHMHTRAHEPRVWRQSIAAYTRYTGHVHSIPPPPPSKHTHTPTPTHTITTPVLPPLPSLPNLTSHSSPTQRLINPHSIPTQSPLKSSLEPDSNHSQKLTHKSSLNAHSKAHSKAHSNHTQITLKSHQITPNDNQNHS